MPQFDDTQTNVKLKKLHESEEERLMQILAPKYGIEYINLFATPINSEILKLIPETTARRTEIALFATNGETLLVAVRNPKNPEIMLVLNPLIETGKHIQMFLTTQSSMEHAWEQYDDMEISHAKKQGILDVDPERIKEFAHSIHSHLDVAEKIAQINIERNAHQTSLLIAVIFGGALALNASDIHIEPEAVVVRIRYRIDGILWDVCSFDKSVSTHIVSRLKLLAGVKLNVRREAQDGRFTFNIGTREIEIRTSVIPGAYGESLVMRLLDPSASSFNIEYLGMNARMHEIMLEELKRPNGTILTTGPTGSGKTTALYAFLVSIHTPAIKIITLEDPVEYKLPGIVQTQVNSEYTFERGLRTILRQDPDVILVGEIRDREVADTTISAALTGHLVFSTLHTNNAAGAIPRLIHFGIDPRTIGSACNIILGQRLVRKLCDVCKVERALTIEEQKLLHRIFEQPIAIHSVFESKGCDACDGSGYKGRTGVFEAIQIDAHVVEAIINDPRESTILAAAKHQNIPTMQQDGLMKVLGGITTLDEVSRVLDLYHLE